MPRAKSSLVTLNQLLGTSKQTRSSAAHSPAPESDHADGAESEPPSFAPVHPSSSPVDHSTPTAARSSTDAGGVSSDDWVGDLSIPKPKDIWHGVDGLAVTIFGIALPALMFVGGFLSMPKRITLVLLNHPIETIVEMLLLLAIPITSYLVWSSFCKNKLKFSRLDSVALGAGIGGALVTTGVCGAALFAANPQLVSDSGTDFAAGFTWMGFLSILAAATGTYLAYRMRQARDFSGSRRQVVVYTAIGALLSLLTVAAAEARPWCIRIAEHMAASTSAAESKQGLAWLRQMNPERELLMECSDSRAAGLAGLFIPLKSSTQHQLYFQLTGKPYSFKDINNANLASMPDDYLSRHVVGDRINGLSLTR